MTDPRGWTLNDGMKVLFRMQAIDLAVGALNAGEGKVPEGPERSGTD
jgi:hypothetical protein